MFDPKLYKGILGNTYSIPQLGFEYTCWKSMLFPLPMAPSEPIIKVGDWIYKPRFPKFERDLGIPKSNILIVDHLSSKAKIYHESGIIVLDKSLSIKLSDSAKLFILLHERGHNYYKSEDSCDIYASQIMRKLGFPIKSILQAQIEARNGITCLSESTSKHFGNHE